MTIVLIIFLITFLLYFKNIIYPKLRKWKITKGKIDKFLGGKRYPVLGDQHIFNSSTRKELFQNTEDFLNLHGNVAVKTWLFHIPIISLQDADDIERVIANVEHIKKGKFYDLLLPWLGTGLLTSSDEKWHFRRKILTPTFHFNILQKFLEIFHKESLNLVENLKKNCNEEINVIPFITEYTLYSISETAMGTTLKSLPNSSEYIEGIHSLILTMVERILKIWCLSDFIFRLTKYYRTQKKIIKSLHNFSHKFISERKKNIQELIEDDKLVNSQRKKIAMLDLLLIQQQKFGNIDDEGIREEVDTFMFEGHDTTASILVYILMLLANNKNCQDEIYKEIISTLGRTNNIPKTSDLQELKYMEMCIKESLRLYPSVPLISRIANSDIELKNGLIIPEGCDINIYIHYLHRDPKYYPDPEKFDPDRFSPENSQKRHPFAYLPFSAGPRNCIGQKFAMMEMKSCLIEILKNFTLEPVDTPKDIIFVSDLVLRPHGPVRVKFLPRYNI